MIRIMNISRRRCHNIAEIHNISIGRETVCISAVTMTGTWLRFTMSNDLGHIYELHIDDKVFTCNDILENPDRVKMEIELEHVKTMLDRIPQ